MEQYNLEFCFKGNRSYVHGTDIYHEISNLLSSNIEEKFDLSFHGIATNNMLMSQRVPKDNNLIKFVCKYIDKSKNKIVLYGTELESKIECRYEYLESDICALSKVNIIEREVILSQDSSYSFIENNVALNKYLLETLFPDINGKWYFTRLQLKQLPKGMSYPLKLILKANFNFKLTKTEIFIANQSIGFIYFSLV